MTKKSELTMDQLVEILPSWERMLKLDLYMNINNWNSGNGLSKEVSEIISAQASNYLTGEDWEADYLKTKEEIVNLINLHKSKIITSSKSFLETDVECRKILVDFLRIKNIVLYATVDGYIESKIKDRIQNILETYGSEFPDEPSPVKFAEDFSKFHSKIFPIKIN